MIFRRHWLVYFYLIGYFVLASLVVVHRFRQFEIFYFNHGIYDSSLWQAAQLINPQFDHIDRPRMYQMADHFNPTLYLLTPIYWLTHSYEAILVVEVGLVVLSALVIAFLAKRFTKNELMILAIVTAYTLFIGVQNGLLAGFHPEFLGMLFLPLAILALETKRWKLMWLFIFLTLSIKESVAPLIFLLGVFIAVRQRFPLFVREGQGELQNRFLLKTGISISLISIVWYFGVTKFLIPTIFNHPYIYSTSPVTLSSLFLNWINAPTKLEVYGVSLATFGLLPIINLAFLPVILQDFLVRFVLNAGSARWDLGMHYNLMLSTTLALGSIYGLSWLKTKKWYTKVEPIHAVLIILITLSIHAKTHHGPLLMGINRAFYANTPNNAFLYDFLEQVPPGKSVMTMNNLAPHLTHQFDEIYLLRPDLTEMTPEYIVLDLRSGQNANNFWPQNEASTNNLKALIGSDEKYELFYSSGDQYIYKVQN